MTAARQLGIRWDEILDVPETVVDAAWQNWLAERGADIEIGFKQRR